MKLLDKLLVGVGVAAVIAVGVLCFLKFRPQPEAAVIQYEPLEIELDRKLQVVDKFDVFYTYYRHFITNNTGAVINDVEIYVDGKFYVMADLPITEPAEVELPQEFTTVEVRAGNRARSFYFKENKEKIIFRR